MTILSVVYVPEGIAMSADSRLTGTKAHNGQVQIFTITDNAQKLSLVRNSTVGISFYGNAIIDGKTTSDFIRVFDINEVLPSDTVQGIADKLQRYLVNKYQNYDVAFLMAGYDQDEPYVFNIDKHAVKLLNYDASGTKLYGLCWRGQESVMTRVFNGAALNPELMPLKDAVDLSEFVVDTTVNFLRFEDNISTCGGPTDSVVITQDFTKFVKHKIFQP